jgi:predicted DNA binding protein
VRIPNTFPNMFANTDTQRPPVLEHMPTARLTITIPEDIWIGELSRKHADAAFEILTAFPKDRGGIALTEITATDGEAIMAAMESYDDVLDIDLLRQTDETLLVQFETSDPILLLPLKEAGTPFELPFTVSDGRVNWEITATQDRLSNLADQLREFDITFDVRSVTHEIETTQLLTDRQIEILTRAVELGYYDTPRKSTLTELAEDLGLAKSTCSETLHRAEEKVIKQFTTEVDHIDADAIGVPEQ